MADQNKIDNLKRELGRITQFRSKNLLRRSTWGEIDFQKASADIDLVFSIATELTELPLEHLPEKRISNIRSNIPSVVEGLTHIDNFNLTTSGEPTTRRDSIIQFLHNAVERLDEIAGPQIPYLAYRHGDVSKNIEAMNSAKDKAEETLENINTKFKDKERQLDEIISVAKDASATVGVATFTQEFDNEATNLNNKSRNWLIATGGFALLTILAAGGLYFWPKILPDADAWETLRNVVSKAAIIAVLFTATIWCGRIYRALMHQSTINRHRALSLKTFQAFVAATYDERIKDAVLMAATRTIFGRVQTGLVSDTGSEHESEVNFVEFGRPSVDKRSGTNEN